MRSMRWFSVAILVVLAACAQGSERATSPDRGPSDLLVLTSTDGLTAVDSRTGSVLFTGSATPALADGSQLFTTSLTGSNTIVEAIGSATGSELARARLHGDL